ncbi:MAG: leucine-rich repeat domain-containing protein [Oscillospiraceae bacterium]|nr:leucine-rich repeat domain-containing protein [Oscillospiraceae bacterium]
MKVKKLLTTLASAALWAILVAVCLCSLSLDASAATKSDLTFTLNEDGESYSVTDCNTNATGTLTIPATYNGKPVTAIGHIAFQDCSKLTSITIPNGVTDIGNSAFADCSGLTDLKIPNSIATIGEDAFANCAKLTYNTYDNARYLGNKNNPYVVLMRITSVEIVSCNIYEQTRLIYDYAFFGCSSLSAVTIPGSVIGIGEAAFAYCSSLTGITIPDGVTGIGYHAFYECRNLERISIPDSIASIGTDAFTCTYYSSLEFNQYDNALYLGNQTNPYVVLVKAASDDITSCHIHSATRVIAYKAFRDCANLTDITIPEGVVSIGDRAFFGCSSLTGINIPDSVVSIGYSAFEGCVGLKSATIGNSVTEIGTKAFYQCISLTGIAIPDSVTVIGDNIFEGCASLKSAVIGNGVSRIGYYAFGYCGSLTDVTIGSGVTCIDAWAFDYCGSLTQISVPKGVTDISCDFSHCYSLTAINVNKNNPNYCSVSGVLFNKAKTKLLRVPGGFSGAYTVPDGVTDVGYAFVTCIKLTSVTISKDVAWLSGSSFDGCSSLKKIIVNKNNPNFSSVSGVLFDKAKTKLIRVPCGKSGAYTVQDGVTAFGDYAFEDCALLTEVTIPEGVQLLYYRLFSGCTHLKKITIPDSVNDIKYDAFTGCDSLQYNKYQNACYLGNAKNPYHALIKGVSKDIKKCTIHPKTKLIAEEAFLDYDHLTAITIPGSVEIVQPRAFQYCSGLTSLTITEGVKEICSDAFRGCMGLTKLVIPNGVVLDGCTFRNCSNLKKIFFYGDEQSRWGGSFPVFYGVTATAYYPVNNESWDSRMSYWGDGLTWKSWTPFKLITQPKTAYAIVGDTAKVTVKVAGDGLKYQWYYKNAGDVEYKLASVKKATYSCKMTAGRNGRYLKCRVTDQYGNSVWTKEVRLHMTDLAITAQPVSKAVKKGVTAKFTVKPNGTNVTFQWQFRTSAKAAWKNSAATGSKTKTLSVPATVGRNGYQYRCRIKDSEGNTVYSNTVTLHVLAIKTQPVSKTVLAGKTAKFTVSAIGNGLRFQWQYRTSPSGTWKNASATGNKTRALSVLAAAAKNGYQYRCRITDSAGNVTYSNIVTLKVK